MRYGKHLFFEGFKPPSLANFNGCNDPYKHVISINTWMAIIGVLDSLKYKILSDTFKDASQRDGNGPNLSFHPNYQDLVNKLVHKFSASRHRNISTTSLFNIRKG